MLTQINGVAYLSPDPNHWTARYIPAKPTDTPYEIHAAMLAGGLNSDVKAGENRGRHLLHEFTVLNLVQIGMVTSNGTAIGRFISDTFRCNSEQILAISVWVTRAGRLVKQHLGFTGKEEFEKEIKDLLSP